MKEVLKKNKFGLILALVTIGLILIWSASFSFNSADISNTYINPINIKYDSSGILSESGDNFIIKFTAKNYPIDKIGFNLKKEHYLNGENESELSIIIYCENFQVHEEKALVSSLKGGYNIVDFEDIEKCKKREVEVVFKLLGNLSGDLAIQLEDTDPNPTLSNSPSIYYEAKIRNIIDGYIDKLLKDKKFAYCYFGSLIVVAGAILVLLIYKPKGK